MARLRAVAVAMPPLLVDIIRHVLTRRTQFDLVAEIPASPRLIERLQALDPDLVMIGETNAESLRSNSAVVTPLQRAKVITVSRDGRCILMDGNNCELTADTLADLLQEQLTQ